MSEHSKELLANYLNSEMMPQGCLDYIACQGFITAMAVREDNCDTDELLKLITDSEPTYQSATEQKEVGIALQSMFVELNRRLYLGEDLLIPAALKPAKAGHTNDLTDWCFGFMEAIAAFEEDWFSSNQSIDAVAELILPITVFSEPHVDPELIHLVQSEKDRQSLASEIPDNLQQLYLLFRE